MPAPGPTDPPAHATPVHAGGDTPVPRWLTPSARRGWQGGLALLVLTVCWLAFSPAPPVQVNTGWDKTNHLLAFATLAMVAEAAFWHVPRRRWRNTAALLAFGLFIEAVQSQIPQRSGEWPDLLADALGMALGLGVMAVLLPAAPRAGRADG